MLFIIVGHIGGRGNIQQMAIIAPHAVNCFVLTSGYYPINSNFKKVEYFCPNIQEWIT